MRANRKWVRLSLCFSTAMMLLAGCSAGGDVEPDAGSTATDGEDPTETDTSADDEAGNEGGAADGLLTAVMPFEVGSVDPHSGAVMARLLRGNVTEPLIEIEATTTELIPGLATTWEATDDTTWLFELEQGVTFSNGEPFNAEVVAYNVDRIVSEEVVASHASYFENITDVQAVDEHTVQMTTAEPDPLLPRNLVNLPMVPPEASEGVGYPITEPIGTGPYVVEAVEGDRIVLAVNSDYRGDSPGVQRVEMVSRPEPSARAFALQADEADLAWDVPTEEAGSVPKAETSPILESMHFKLNALRGIFTDIRVREAVTIGVDVELIRTSIIGDEFSTPANNQIAPVGVEGYDDSLSVPEHDPDRARQLIQEAGVEGDTVSVMAPSGRYPKGEEVTEAWALGLEEIGLQPELEFVDYDTWLENLRGAETSTVDALLFGAGSEQGTALQPMSTLYRTEVISTFPHEDAPELLELMEQAYQEFDDQEREQLIQQVQAMANEQFANVYLYVPNTVYGMAANVSFQPRQDGRILFQSVTMS